MITMYRIITNNWQSGWENYYRYGRQRSETKNLDVSEDYILAAEFKEGSSGDYIQVV